MKVPVVQSNGQFGDNGLTVTTPNGLNKEKSPILRVLKNMVKSSDSRDTANSEHVTTDSGKGESEHESLSSHHQVTNNNYRYIPVQIPNSPGIHGSKPIENFDKGSTSLGAVNFF